MSNQMDDMGFESFGTPKTTSSGSATSQEVLGMYGKPHPQQDLSKRPKSFVINRRSFIKGGINQGTPPYLLKDEQWLDSRNFVFDFDKARALPGRKIIDQLVASTTNLYLAGSVNDSLCVGANVPPPNDPFLTPVPPAMKGLLWTLPAHFMFGVYNDYSGTSPTGFWYCVVNPPTTTSGFTVSGLPTSGIYNAVIRVRGVMETRELYTGFFDGDWIVGGTQGPDYGPIPGSNFNYYKLSITNSPNISDQVFFLNPSNSVGISRLTLICYLFDYIKTVQVQNGSVLTFDANSEDGFSQANDNQRLSSVVPPTLSVFDDDITRPIQVTQPYNGQFAQFDTLSLFPI